MERMKRIAKRVYVGECSGIRSMGRPWKRWIDTVKVFKEKWFGCQASKENGPVCGRAYNLNCRKGTFFCFSPLLL